MDGVTCSYRAAKISENGLGAYGKGGARGFGVILRAKGGGEKITAKINCCIDYRNSK